MRLQELQKKDFRIIVCSIILGLTLMVLTGLGEVLFAIMGIGIAISVIYKVKNIKRILPGNTLDEITKSFMIYIFIPIQSFISIVLIYWFISDFFF